MKISITKALIFFQRDVVVVRVCVFGVGRPKTAVLGELEN